MPYMHSLYINRYHRGSRCNALLFVLEKGWTVPMHHPSTPTGPDRIIFYTSKRIVNKTFLRSHYFCRVFNI